MWACVTVATLLPISGMVSRVAGVQCLCVPSLSKTVKACCVLLVKSICECVCFLQVLQCLDIMITSRQHELAEAAASQEAATRHASGSTAEITQDLDSAACGHNRSNSRYGVGGAISRSSSRLATHAAVMSSASNSRLARQTSAASDLSWMAGPFGPQDL